MKNKHKFSTKIFPILALVAVLGFGTYAFAGWGWGHHMNDGRGYGHHGYGYHHGYGDDYQCPGWGAQENLSREDIEKLEKQRDAFYQDTEKLRSNLFQKERALSNELDMENPDRDKAAKLQKEISGLRTELDQKRIDHLIQMRKIAPNAGMGRMGRYDRGASGYGRPCWN